MVENAFLLVGDGGFQISERALIIYVVQLDRTLKIRETLYSSLLNHLQIDQKFSTSFISTVLKQRVNVNGWQLYDPVYEYLRMGVETNIVLKSLYQCKFQVKRITKYFPNLHQNEQMSFLASNPQVIQSIEDDTISQPTNENILQPTAYNYQEDPRLPETPGFVMQQYNYDYSVCETYPALLAFPGFLTITQIKQVAQFRSSQRLPALLWTMSNMPCIIRCSQPCQGLKGEASIVDKQMINGFCCKRYPKSIIFDACAQLNVQVNQIMEFYNLGYMTLNNIVNTDYYQKLANSSWSSSNQINSNQTNRTHTSKLISLKSMMATLNIRAANNNY
ncbi:Myotubularin-like_protein [Hexamita inflata]|uniref:Myotubularin-like_protein n=1 Tax=Hexamita inflata TaxID=28002 RepID=A0ABP1HPH9_9EUKA